MAAVAQFHIFPANSHRKTTQPPPLQLGFCRSSVLFESIPPFSRRKVCRSFMSEEGKNGAQKEKKKLKTIGDFNKNRGRNVLGAIKSLMFWNENSMEKLEENLSKIALHFGRYIVTMMSTGVILSIGFNLSGGDGQMNDLIWYSWVGGIIIGTMIGSNMVLDDVSRAGPRNVVITGSTRGLGKALAREFLLSGDRVVIASRSEKSVDMTIKELEENLQEGMATAMSSSRKNLANAKVVGTSCDVCDPKDVRNLANFAVNELGSIDIWINNAGTNKGFRPLLEFTDEDIQQIVSTNLVGSILCTREAMRVMSNQHKAGHIFNMDGAGSGGSSTPLTAVYGSTKCGLRQLQSSLFKECRKSKVGVHTASPGMVLTDLLLSGSTIQNKQMFNIICELPETVARTLGRALYAAEADRLRNWAESRARFSFTDAMEMYTENTWVSVFSLSVVCAFIILSSTTGNASGHIDNFHIL
ncbi:hypothetical protein OSB04_031329 [Centaurea solstitialis]|uniref:chlorophyll(ide) b reductase n=1 Tax=Centaurea solstitialis TaxID=347529 RepID=A0AA38W807_9ASTR|nr:hypothetical protein OSB04_031329 [Centaurea solstitialis]